MFIVKWVDKEYIWIFLFYKEILMGYKMSRIKILKYKIIVMSFEDIIFNKFGYYIY